MKDTLIATIIGLASIFILTIVIFASGRLDNIYLATIGKERANIKREVFKEGKSYVEGMIEDLSSYKREFERTDDISEKEQIANMIDAEFSNFDANKIENASLYNFLMDIRNGAWK